MALKWPFVVMYR